MAQWFFSYNGQQVGPLDDAAARAQAASNPNGHCWRQGFTDWQPVGQVAELRGNAGVPVPAAAMPPVAPGGRRADDIDFKIVGQDMQFVEIELDPGESAIAEAGAMMYKDASVQLDTVFGDGSQSSSGSGFMGKLLSAGKRLVTGESLFTTVFTHSGSGKARVAFAAPYPGTILAMHLSDVGGRLICQKDSFLCAARGVSIGIHFQRKILTGLFGGEGFIMQKLEGDGLAFVHAGGTVVERELAPGERLDVDTGCVVALTDTVGFDVKPVGGIKSMMFGGEGVFLANLTGPGKVWLQSLPFSRMAGRMLAAAPQRGGSSEEGSVLGGLGGLIMGKDN
ncbi:TIGR00266 family protein [Tahibacter amnicola]|uniref:TIGR00266 family protein n=1 Tax=Tahibacter amnicola TaxID=2976241 RepID=A0ABY6BCJ3_9GAMM|nr:TIGR00266 family protein [Tahibacter amnicola]UXI67449.1 TIGR00266 family protein [Tahibacter amnicola]